jgi:hypothetical protein
MVPAWIAARTTLAAQIVAITNIGGSGVQAIPVTFRSRGAQIVFDRTVIGFGPRPIGLASSQAFRVSNIGDVAATVAIAMPGGEFSRRFGDAGAVTVFAGASVTGDVGYLPVDLGADTALAGVTVTGARCGLVSDRLTLSGTGVAGTDVMVQGGPLDFGDVGCGVAPAARQIHLVNPSALDAQFTASLLATVAGDERLYHVVPAEGTVPAGGAIDLVVSAEAIRRPASPRTYAATLRVTTTLGGVRVSHDLAVRQTLRAAELLASRSLVDFGVFPAGSLAQFLQLTISNIGNAAATLRVTPVNAPFGLAAPTTIASNGTGTMFVRYIPTSSPSTQQVVVEALDACTAPLAIELRGGTGPFAVVEPATATATCPPPASMSTELRISNLGNQSLGITCHEHGTSGLALQFPPPVAFDFDSGRPISLIVPPYGGAAVLPVTMSPGPIQAGSVTAFVECVDNEPINKIHMTTITRTLVEDGEPCAAPSAP